MDDSTLIMEIALRVLTAICDNREPDSSAVEELRRAVPMYAHWPIDDLACHAIQVGMQHRKLRRELRSSELYSFQ